MKKQLFWTLLTLVTISTVNGQSILKKREVSSRLDQISTEINNKEFEKAITIFYNKQEVISEEKVRKRDLDQYERIKTTLEQKKKEFDRNKEKVNAYQRQYNSADYCTAIDLLGLTLTKENSYKETQDIQNKLRSPLTKAKQKCEDNGNKLSQWKRNYQNKDYEKLYHLLDIGYSEKNYFYQRDLTELETLQNSLKDKYKVYKSVKDKIITMPEKTINLINFNTLTYEQSEQYIKELTTVLGVSDSELQKPEGNNPDLTQDFAKFKTKIENKIAELKKFSDANRPLTKKEIAQHISSGEPISMDFIENNCQHLERLGGIFVSNNLPFYAYDLDVLKYYSGELNLETDLQKASYKNSADYHTKKAELSKIRQEMLQATYYIKKEEAFKETDYSMSAGGVKILISSNVGYAMAGATPLKCVESVEMTKCKIITEGNALEGKDDKLILPISTDNALKIEKNRDNISIYFLFKIKDKYTKSYQFTDLRGQRWNIKDPVFRPHFVRILVVNDITDEIYFDKTYN